MFRCVALHFASAIHLSAIAKWLAYGCWAMAALTAMGECSVHVYKIVSAWRAAPQGVFDLFYALTSSVLPRTPLDGSGSDLGRVEISRFSIRRARLYGGFGHPRLHDLERGSGLYPRAFFE